MNNFFEMKQRYLHKSWKDI